MGVYIKGMRMPKNCYMCRFCDWSNLHQTASCKLKDYEPCFSDYSKEYRTQRSTICPLVDLGKHGDLIDRDKLLRDIEKYHVSDGKFQHWTEIQNALIEAEDGT